MEDFRRTAEGLSCKRAGMKRRKIVGMESCKKVGSLPGIHCKSKETPHNPNLAGYKNHRVKQFCRRLVAPHMTALRKTEVVVGCHKTGEVGEVRRKTVEAAEARRKTAAAVASFDFPSAAETL